ncbi:pilin [Marinomonas pollencensis]|uniref:General secretion pathway protein G/type IV pilus assembly protein PilA n=1 Tax=Marinomonas pollencensis TaxID=491954 RepID=A0A3E0DV02_9GAMM|nr:pilin [Marinomonas pollencensis]REG85489.1 general secretion pathway protein G/type IV pilus assembly protein PilA [Marinomonas pollencensis]
MNHSRVHQGGFTLLELMVVIAIISILAAITAPTFTRQITKAKLVEAQNIATQSQSFIEEYILLNGGFPSSTEFAEISPIVASDSIVKSIAVSDQEASSGSVTVSLNSDTGISEGNYLKYHRDANNNWQCESDLASKLLPQQCTTVEEAQ